MASDFRIDINDEYCITADSMQYIVNSKGISQGEKTKGQEVLCTEAYLSTFSQCLKFITDRSIRLSDAHSFKDVVSVLNKVNEEILKACTLNGIRANTEPREV